MVFLVNNRVKQKKPTILDIARELGVSKSLVSLALSGGDGVSESSRKRILDAAERLGYSRNTWARSLVSGRTGLIGVVVGDTSSDYNTEVVVGIEDGAVAAGFTTLLAHGRRDTTVMGERVRAMSELGVEGIIIVSSRAPLDVVESVAKKIPVVIVGRPSSMPDGADVIHNNDELGGRLATQHLLDAGHERIGFVGANSGAAIASRYAAYQKTMADAGSDYRWARQHEKADRTTFLKDLVTELKSDPQSPTALFISSDATAVPFVGYALDGGFSIPSELAIVGYNDSRLAAAIRPGLTSVHQPRGPMGELALTYLLERIDGREEDKVSIMEPTLSIRQTSANA